MFSSFVVHVWGTVAAGDERCLIIGTCVNCLQMLRLMEKKSVKTLKWSFPSCGLQLCRCITLFGLWEEGRAMRPYRWSLKLEMHFSNFTLSPHSAQLSWMFELQSQRWRSQWITTIIQTVIIKHYIQTSVVVVVVVLFGCTSEDISCKHTLDPSVRVLLHIYSNALHTFNHCKSRDFPHF